MKGKRHSPEQVVRSCVRPIGCSLKETTSPRFVALGDLGVDLPALACAVSSDATRGCNLVGTRSKRIREAEADRR